MKPSDIILEILEFRIDDNGDRIQQTYKSSIFNCCKELDNKFIDREELEEKINARIMLLSMCSDVYVEEEVKSKLVRIEQLKEILELLKEE